jgi:hypothetical protein
MVYLTVVRYRKWLSWVGVLSMAVFRLPLFFNKNIVFYKLMGSGQHGNFDVRPNLQQWAILVRIDQPTQHFSLENIYGQFIANWWKLSRVQQWTLALQPLEGHGKWDGKEAFGPLPRSSDYEGMIAVLTRATIRMSKAKHFWSNVHAVSKEMAATPGFLFSIGIGEMPWIKQATFSIWQSKESMKQFAYSMQQHKTVIQRTRQENWYSEEMFVRFKIIAAYGDVPGVLTPVLSTYNHQ